MNPLKSISGTMISGFVLAFVLMFLLGTSGTVNPWEFWVWMHVLVGITWIGLHWEPGLMALEAMHGGDGSGVIAAFTSTEGFNVKGPVLAVFFWPPFANRPLFNHSI